MDNKIGDEVMVRGKITEIRETKEGKLYMIEFESSSFGFRSIIVPGKVIVE